MRCLRRIASLAVVLFTLAVSAEAGTADETLSNASMLRANTLWKGDLDGMAARRVIRVLVVYSKTFYFLDGPQQRGLSYELLKEFESFVNRKFKTKTLKIQLVIIPVARDELLPALLEGRGDLAVANLTVTTQRRRKVDFSDPFIKGVSELVISRADAAPIERLEDLAGRTITLRRSSSYYESLLVVNKRLRGKRLDPVRLQPADENLEDEDLLEMVNAGLLPAIVMDSHKAHFWRQIFPGIMLHEACAREAPSRKRRWIVSCATIKRERSLAMCCSSVICRIPGGSATPCQKKSWPNSMPSSACSRNMPSVTNLIIS